MEFLAVLAVLIEMQLSNQTSVLQRDDWVVILEQRIPANWSDRLRLALLVLGPVVLVVFVQFLLKGVLWGIPLLLFYIAVLVYSLGRGDFRQQMQAYYEAWERGDLEAAYQQALMLVGFDHSVGIGDARSLHDQVRKAIFYEGFDRWFVVVFWFMVLGPAAALTYRLFKLLGLREGVSAEQQAVIDNAIYFIEWLPVRLLSCTFALVGNFDQAIRICRAHFLEPTSASEILDESGQLAMAEPLPETYSDEQFPVLALAELHSAQKLVSRSVICWLAGFALLQLI